jgi:hypothetical protein
MLPGVHVARHLSARWGDVVGIAIDGIGEIEGSVIPEPPETTRIG